jgi:hypothetical protein
VNDTGRGSAPNISKRYKYNRSPIVYVISAPQARCPFQAPTIFIFLFI